MPRPRFGNSTPTRRRTAASQRRPRARFRWTAAGAGYRLPAGHLGVAVARIHRLAGLALARHRCDGGRSGPRRRMVARRHRAHAARRPRSYRRQLHVRRLVRRAGRTDVRLRGCLAADRAGGAVRQPAERAGAADGFRSIGASTATFAALALVGAGAWRRGWFRGGGWRRSFAPYSAASPCSPIPAWAAKTPIRRHGASHGLCVGIPARAAGGAAAGRPLGPATQWLAGAAALALVAGAWWLAGSAGHLPAATPG